MAIDYDKNEYTLTYDEEKQKYRLKYSQADVFAVVIAKSLAEAPVEKVDIRIKNSIIHGMTINPINEGVELNNVKIVFENTDNFSGANLIVTSNTDFSVKNNKGACMLYGCKGLILDGACSFSDNRNIKVRANFMRTSDMTNERLRFSELKVENCKNTSKDSDSLINNFADIVFRESSTRNRLNLKNITVDYRSGTTQSTIRGKNIGVDSVAYSNYSIENAKISSPEGIEISETLNVDIKNLEVKADAALSCAGIDKSKIGIDGLTIGEKASLDLLLNPENLKENLRGDIIIKNCAIKDNSKLEIWGTYDTLITLENIDVIDAKARLNPTSFSKDSGDFEIRNVKELKLRGRYDAYGFEVSDCDKFELGLNKPDSYASVNANVSVKNCKRISLKSHNKIHDMVQGTFYLLAINGEVSAKNIEFEGWLSLLCCECVGQKIKADRVTLNNSQLFIKGNCEVLDLVATEIDKITAVDSQIRNVEVIKPNAECKLETDIKQSIVKNVNICFSDTKKSDSEKISIIETELNDSEIRGNAKILNSVISGAITGSTFEADFVSYFGNKQELIEGVFANQNFDEPKQVKPVETIKSDKKINDVEL